MHDTNMITIVDNDMGNVGSVANMCRKAGGVSEISGAPDKVAAANKLILPGVGHFGRAMERLESSGLVEALNEAVLVRRVPILGICLGVQLFARSSEEADVPGLGWIDAKVVRFGFSPAVQEGRSLKVPHMGWNNFAPTRSDDPLFKGLPTSPRAYFVHSYHLECDSEEDVLAWTSHGHRFASAIHSVEHDNIRGTQFHPEKSHKFGLAIMRNFVERIPAREEVPCN